MRPKEYSTEELIAELRARKNKIARESAESWDRDGDEGIIVGCTGGNTFRAFAHMPEPPSEVFRDWARRRTGRAGFARELAKFAYQREFDRWHAAFCGDFCRYWLHRMGRHINFGPGRKLPNLLLEGLTNWNELTLTSRRQLIRFTHLPLDGFILGALRNCIPDFRKEAAEIGRRIPYGATMSYVNNQSVYDAVQRVARGIATKAGTPPIYLDKLIYGGQHPDLE